MILHPAIFAGAIVLGLAAAGSGDGDWELVIGSLGESHPVCTKTKAQCYETIDALESGRWRPVGMDGHALSLTCQPHPGCVGDAAWEEPR